LEKISVGHTNFQINVEFKTHHFLNLLYLQIILILFKGLDIPTPAPEEVARYTVRTMLRSVPAAVPGMEVQAHLINLT
jgi:fructose-bisphosphate aldolase class 1